MEYVIDYFNYAFFRLRTMSNPTVNEGPPEPAQAGTNLPEDGAQGPPEPPKAGTAQNEGLWQVVSPRRGNNSPPPEHAQNPSQTKGAISMSGRQREEIDERERAAFKQGKKPTPLIKGPKKLHDAIDVAMALFVFIF